MLGICVIFPPVPYTQNLFKLSSGPEPSQMIFYVIIFFFYLLTFIARMSAAILCAVSKCTVICLEMICPSQVQEEK